MLKSVSQVIKTQLLGQYKNSPYNEHIETPPNWQSGDSDMVNHGVVMSRKSGLKTDLDSAISAVTRELIVISPEYSAYSDPEKMFALLGSVAVDDLPEVTGVIHINNHSSNILTAEAGARPQITMYEIAKTERLEREQEHGEN